MPQLAFGFSWSNGGGGGISAFCARGKLCSKARGFLALLTGMRNSSTFTKDRLWVSLLGECKVPQVASRVELGGDVTPRWLLHVSGATAGTQGGLAAEFIDMVLYSVCLVPLTSIFWAGVVYAVSRFVLSITLVLELGGGTDVDTLILPFAYNCVGVGK